MILLQNFADLFMESAPWLMLGFAIAGLMKMFIPAQLLAHHLGQPGFWSTVKAAFVGAPLPLCSCGVIPAAMGLRRSGASKAATTSFMIATPETGVDSISLSYALLGPFMAFIRPIAAVTSAIVAGLMVGPDDQDSGKLISESKSDKDKVSDCCQSPSNVSTCCGDVDTTTSQVEQTDSCCQKASHDHSHTQKARWLSKVIEGLRFTFLDLVNDIAGWLVLGLFFAALVKTFMPPEFLAQWGGGFVAFIVMALVGIPMYICATASTPIAAGLLFSGVSPGAVLVFMLAGPATNMATMGLVKKELGGRALFAYLFGVMATAFFFGYLTNYLASAWGLDFVAQAAQVQEMVAPPITYVTSAVLMLLIMRVFWQKWFRRHPHSH